MDCEMRADVQMNGLFSSHSPSYLFARFPFLFLLHHSGFLGLLLLRSLIFTVVPVVAAVAGSGIAVVPVW